MKGEFLVEKERLALEAFLQENGIDLQTFWEGLHKTLLLFVFEELCRKMKDDPGFEKVLRLRFRASKNNARAAQKVSLDIVEASLTEEEGELLSKWLFAYFQKTGVRQKVSLETKRLLLHNQGGLCACCKTKLSLESAHYDHIVPWDLVGDELDENGQMLCEHCNKRKSKSVDYLLKRLIVKKAS
jgi:hypothetical protein